MKKISIDQLERSVPEELLIAAEELAEESGFPDMREVEESLWVARVMGYEVEILLGNRSTRQYTCECGEFKKHGLCPHVVLAIQELRRRQALDPGALEHPGRKSNTRLYGSKRLTTSALLENTSEESLRNFLKAYARENRSFALALRARFSSSVPTSEESEKYKNLLNSIFNSQYKPGKTYSSTATTQVARLLRHVIQDLSEQVAEGQFQAPVLMVRALIEKLPPVLNLAGDDKEILLKILRRGLKLLERLADAPASPQLKFELWEILEAELSKPYCLKNDLHLNILQLLSTLAPVLSREKEYIDLLLNCCREDFLTIPQQIALTALRLETLTRMEEREALDRLLCEVREEEALLFGLIEHQLKLRQQPRTLPTLVTYLFEQNLPIANRRGLSELLLPWLRENEEKQQALKLAQERFLQTRDFNSFNLCRELAGEQWPEVFADLIRKVRKQEHLPADQKARLLAEMLFREGKTPDLLQHLARQESLSLLRKYTPSLLPDAHPLLLDVYYRHFENYLREYLGRKPALRVRNTIEALRQDGARKLADELLERIRRAFPQRQSLMEELEML